MKPLPRAEQQTPEDFAALHKYAVSYLCRFSDGRDYIIKIRTRTRAKMRHGELDIFSTDWAFRSGMHPSGYTFCLNVDCPPEQFGIEMHKAVQSLPKRLVRLRPGGLPLGSEHRLYTPRRNTY